MPMELQDLPGTESPDLPETESPDLPQTESPDLPQTVSADLPKTGLQDLPDEILLKLFEPLTLSQCLKFGGISKRYNRLLSDFLPRKFREVVVFEDHSIPDLRLASRYLSSSSFKLRIVSASWTDGFILFSSGYGITIGQRASVFFIHQ